MNELRIPPERDLPARRLELRADHLVREVALPAAVERGRRRLAVALVPAVLILLGALAFTVYVATRPADELSSIGCYEQARLDGDVTVAAADGRSPIEICADALVETKPGLANGPLTACVLESGAVGVFPGGRDTCARLELPALAQGYKAEAARFAALRDALIANISGSRCVGQAEAERIVRRELEARGFGDWRIETGPGIAGEGFSDERPCASLAFEGDSKTVILVPDAGPGG